MAGPYRLTIIEIKKKGALRPDAWWMVLAINPISLRFVWALARFLPQITPNGVTCLGFAFGLVSVYLYANELFIWAVILYQFSLVCDQADGQLARSTDRATRVGEAFDISNDILLYGLRILALFMVANQDEPLAALVGGSLLVLYVLNLAINTLLDREKRDTWARFSPHEDSWLRRNGLLYPLHWPERHLLIFVIGPLAQLTIPVAILVIVLESLLTCAKVAKLFSMARREDQKADQSP